MSGQLQFPAALVLGKHRTRRLGGRRRVRKIPLRNRNPIFRSSRTAHNIQAILAELSWFPEREWKVGKKYCLLVLGCGSVKVPESVALRIACALVEACSPGQWPAMPACQPARCMPPEASIKQAPPFHFGLSTLEATSLFFLTTI